MGVVHFFLKTFTFLKPLYVPGWAVLVALDVDLGDFFTRLELDEVVLLIVGQRLRVLERDCLAGKVKSLHKVFVF